MELEVKRLHNDHNKETGYQTDYNRTKCVERITACGDRHKARK